MALEFISGYYTISFNSSAVGRTEVGFEKIIRPSFNVIRADDAGRTPLDAIWTGVEDCIIRAELIEWDITVWQKLFPWMYSGGTPAEGHIAISGTLLNAGSVAASLVLTPVTGPAVTSGKTWTFTKALPLEPVRMPFSSQRLRTLTVGFYCFASAVTSYVPTMFSVA